MHIKNFWQVKVFVTATLLLCSFLAEAQVKYKKTANGLEYKIFTSNKGEKAKLDDVIKFDFVMKNQKDSIINSSYITGKPGMVKVQKPAFQSDPMEGLAMLTVGDSAIFKINADSFFKGNGHNPCGPGEFVTLTVKMHDIKSYAEYMQEIDRENAEAIQKESVILENLINTKYPQAKKTASGMYYIITKPGTGPNAAKDVTVKAHYKGMLANGEVFDTDSGRGEPFSFKLGAHQVIPGWDEGFTYLNKGAKATLILPSKLAYGARGAGGQIPPFATLIFEVELVDFK